MIAFSFRLWAQPLVLALAGYRCVWASPSLPLDCACGGGRAWGSKLVKGRIVREVSLSEKVMLVFLAVEGAVKEGYGFSPSNWVLGRGITVCAIRWLLSWWILSRVVKVSTGS